MGGILLKYDKPLVAALLGALSTVPAEMVSRIMLYSGIGQYSIYQLDSMLITFNRPHEMLGLIVNFIIGGTVGVIFYYSIKLLGYDYLIYKSVFVGILASALTEFLITGLIEGKYIEIRPISDYYLHIVGALVFGLTLGILFNRFIFNKPILT